MTGTSSVVPLIVSAVIAVFAIAAATVAVSLGKIDASTYSTIVAVFGGAGFGVGAHAAGTRA